MSKSLQTQWAVDIVLLFPSSVENFAMEANRRLREEHAGDIILGPQGGHPHLSLAMGGLFVDEVPAYLAALETLAQRSRGPFVQFEGVIAEEKSEGPPVTWLAARPDPSLRELQDNVFSLNPALRSDVERRDFHSSTRGAQVRAVDHVRQFAEHRRGPCFRPHITLGYGPALMLPAPPPSFAKSIALCHLGSSCTCPVILGAYAFSNDPAE